MGASFASRVAHVTRCSRSQSLTRPVPVCGFLLGCCRRKPRTPNSPNKRHSMHRRYGRSRRYSCPCLTTVFKVERASASKGRVRVRLEVLSRAPDGHVSFQLAAKRYEKGALMLSSNQSFREWGELFTAPEMATALLDRLLPHALLINSRGQGFRLKAKRQAGGPWPRGVCTGAIVCKGREDVP
jgi:IstB-like ATP binding protein